MKLLSRRTTFLCIMLSSFLIMLIWCSFCTQTFASEQPSKQLSHLPSDTPVITSVFDAAGIYQDLEELPTIRILKNNNDSSMKVYEFIFTLTKVSAILNTAGEDSVITVPVHWDATNTSTNPVDQSRVGIYTVTGTLQFDDSYTVADNVIKELSVKVEVYEPNPENPIPIVKMESPEDEGWMDIGFSLAQNGTLDPYIFDGFETWTCYDENGDMHKATINWDTSIIDNTTIGNYTLIPTFHPPINCYFAVDSDCFVYPDISITICVQAPGQPELSYLYQGARQIRFPWVFPDCESTEFHAFLSTDNVTWRELTAETDYLVNTSDFILRSNALQRNIPGTFYLQVEYDGGKTGIVTFTYDTQASFVSYHYGDRDGGDTDGNPPGNDETDKDDMIGSETPNPDPPSPTPPASEPPTSPEQPDNSEQPDAPVLPDTPVQPVIPEQPDASVLPDTPVQPDASEQPDATDWPQGSEQPNISAQPVAPAWSDAPVPTDTPVETEAPVKSEMPHSKPKLSDGEILGETILQMLTSTQMARFSNDGISAVFSKASMEALQIQKDDIFRITLKLKDKNTFHITVLRNGTLLTDFENLKIQIPYETTQISPLLLLLYEDHTVLAEGDFDPAKQIATFTVSQTGSFQISEKENADALHTADVSDKSSDIKQTNTFAKSNASLFPVIVTLLILLFLPVIFICLRHKRRKK